MIFVLPEIFLLLVLAFLLGMAVGWMLWRWRRGQAQRSQPERTTTTSAKPEMTRTILDLTHPAEEPAPADTVHPALPVTTVDGAEPVGDVASAVVAGSPNGGFTLLAESPGSMTEELAMTQDLLLTSQDDLSSAEADLALVQEDLAATRELLMRAESELAAERNLQNQGSISEEEE